MSFSNIAGVVNCVILISNLGLYIKNLGTRGKKRLRESMELRYRDERSEIYV